MRMVNAATALRSMRARARLSLRDLAERAGTSHSTLSAYESGRVNPTVETFDRVARAAGFMVEAHATSLVVDGPDVGARGRELAEVLELAENFPVHHAKTLPYPRFGPA